MSRNTKKEEVEQPQGTLFVTPLEEVLPSSMLPFAEYVILDRAIPRVEDGLKPVQRRILYTMSEMGLMPDKPHKKSARIVGDCMGKYHPHGDSSVYDAMVRMAQDFNMGMTLVNGHGNFGSVDGDPPAAMRYTEARLEPLALELLRDLDKNTVPFSLNFDDSLKEPDMLPGRYPNLLVNGASGIAVGVATNIPPHNLGEAIDGVVAFIDNPRIKLEDMMKLIPAPDFPTGGYIIANELNEAYRTGKGRITLRAKIAVEEGEGERKQIVITELPYQVNKAQLLRKIAELREEKKEEMALVTKVVDESDRTGMRAVIEVKKDADIPALMRLLYKYTDLETTFGINMVAIAKGKPMLLGILDIIRYYVDYQREVVLRRSRFELNEAKERSHILEGLIIAVRNIDEVIAIIKKAESTSDAREKLKKRFELSDRQAQAILDLRLARLTKLEVFKLEQELAELKKTIDRLTSVVNSQRLQLGIVREEMLEIKKKYARPRKTVLVDKEEDALPERNDIRAPGVPSVFCICADHSVKCVTEKNFNMSSKEVGDKTKLSSLVVEELHILSDKAVLMFSDLGNAYYFVPMDGMRKFNESGYKLADLFPDAKKSEKIVSVIRADAEFENVLFITKNGMLKRTAWSEYSSMSKGMFGAIRLNDGDKVLSVQPFEDSDSVTIYFVTKEGMCLNARTDDIPVQGRIAGGVRGMNLSEEDEVIFASQVDEGEGELIIVIGGSRFKRVIAGQIDSLPRYRKGIKIAALKDDEKVTYAGMVTVPYILAVDTDEGFKELSTEELPIDATNTRGRALKGVKWTAKGVYALRYRELDD